MWRLCCKRAVVQTHFRSNKVTFQPKKNCFNNAPCCFVLCFAVQLTLLARQLLKSRTSWPSWLSTCQETRLCSRRWQHKLAAMHTRYTALLPRHSGPHEGLFGCRGLGSAAKAGFNLCRATQVYSSCIFTAHGEVIAPPGQQRSQQLDRLRLSARFCCGSATTMSPAPLTIQTSALQQRGTASIMLDGCRLTAAESSTVTTWWLAVSLCAFSP